MREPRLDESFVATPEAVRELASAYAPVLRYADGERFFPVLAESWLTHSTSAPWEAAQAEPDDLPADPAQRGTAILEGSGSLASLARRGGTPNPDDRPIQLATAGGDRDAIGNYDEVDASVFLDFGGWKPDSGRRQGDEAYLYAAFSELAAAMNPTQRWELIEGMPHLPHMWVPQPVTPTVYAEVDWAGVHPRASHEHGHTEFQSPESVVNTQLDGYLTLTYYYLYPMRDLPPEGESTRRLEGQWEAIALFFGATASRDLDANGRPLELSFREPPEFVVASQGHERSLDRHVTSLRPWNQTERQGTQVILYVTQGTHRHFWAPATGVTWDPTANAPSPNPYGPDDEGEFPGIEMLLVWAAVLLVIAAILLALGAFVLAAIAAILAILLLILWLISLIADAINNASGDPVPEWEDNDEANGDGAQAGGSEPAAGSSSETPPSGSPPAPGTPNAGSPTGRNTVSFDVRIVDLLHLAGERTPFPPGQAVEHPHWWDYSGAWGISVPTPNAAGDWESGTVRVDRTGRSWSYWSALKVVEVSQGGSPEG